MLVLALVLVVSLSVAGVSAAFAAIPDNSKIVTDYLADVDGSLDLTQGAAKSADGTSIEMKGPANPRVNTKSAVASLSTFEFTMDFSKPTGAWVTYVMFMDMAPGAAPWEGDARTADKTAYALNISSNVIAFVRYAGTSASAPIGAEYNVDADAFFKAGTAHTFRIDVETALAGTKLTLTLDGEKVIEGTDDSANKLANDGAITIISKCDDAAPMEAKITAFRSTSVQAFDYELTSDIEGNFTLTDATADENSITLPKTGITRVQTNESVPNMTSLKLTMNLSKKADATDWLAMMFFMDNAPGKTSWERSEASEKGYCLMFNPTVIGISLQIGASSTPLTDSEYTVPSGFYDTPHTYELNIKKSLAQVEIELKIDGEVAIAKAVDDTANKILDDGFITLANHNVPEAEITISDMTVRIDPTQKIDTALFDEASLQDGMGMLVGSNAQIDTENGKVTMENDAIASVYTTRQYRNVKLCAEMALNVSDVASDYDDWLAMLAISDQTPNIPPWVTTPQAAGERYMFVFYKDEIVLSYYNGSKNTEIATYSVPAGFYAESHTYNVVLAALSGGVEIKMNIDDGAIEFDAKDTADTKILKAGSVYILTQGDQKVGAEITKFKTSAPEEEQEEIETDFDFDSVETQLDFTDLVDRDNWTGTMQEAVFAGQTIFYKGGTKDNIYLGGPNIKTAGTHPDGDIQYTDFVLTFKATVTWPQDAGDWGGMLTFRDSEPGLTTWEQNAENDRVAYGIKWDLDSQNSDNSTNGTISIMRFNGAGGGVGIASRPNMEINGKEITYKLACVNGEDEKGEFVRIVLLADGAAIADVKDYGVNNEITEGSPAGLELPNITGAGGFMIMNHNTRTFHIKGWETGEAVEELVVGGSTEDPGDNPGGDPGDNPGDNPGGDYDGDEDNQTDEPGSGCSSAVAWSSAAFAVTAIGVALAVVVVKKRKI